MNTIDEFGSSGEIFVWLSQFINLEQGYTPPSMRPERMEIIAEAAGHPERCAPAIHVAGSKGKGSITAMVSRILEAEGLRVARYMSPHVTEYRERITLGDKFFDEAIYLAAGNRLKKITATLTDAHSAEYKALQDVSDGSPEPTFFELLTLLYFLCAQEAKVDALVVETGMGGRLDPTNVVPAVVSVITIIELEHTEFLGTTIEQVAGEKAGIIKAGKTAIIAAQSYPAALDVFKKTAAEKNTKLYYYPDTVAVENIRITQRGTDFTLVFKQNGFFDAPLHLSIAIPGVVQAGNAAIAVLAAKKAFPAISAETALRGLQGFNLIARFEKIKDQPPVIVDGAHTDISVHLCVKTFTDLYGSGGILIFGCALGKNADAMAQALLPHFSHIVITTPGTYKMSEPEKVYATFEKLQKGGGAAAMGEGVSAIGGSSSAVGGIKNQSSATKITFIKETQKGIAVAIDEAAEKNLPVLGIGSFYLAAEIRNFVLGK